MVKYMSSEPYMTPSNLLLTLNNEKNYTNHFIEVKEIDFDPDTPIGLITRFKDSEEKEIINKAVLSCSMQVLVC